MTDDSIYCVRCVIDDLVFAEAKTSNLIDMTRQEMTARLNEALKKEGRIPVPGTTPSVSVSEDQDRRCTVIDMSVDTVPLNTVPHTSVPSVDHVLKWMMSNRLEYHSLEELAEP